MQVAIQLSIYTIVSETRPSLLCFYGIVFANLYCATYYKSPFHDGAYYGGCTPGSVLMTGGIFVAPAAISTICPGCNTTRILGFAVK
jgi:hypothetical protein